MAPVQLSLDYDTVKEEWRDCPGYEGQYQVSSFGRVRGCDRLASDGRRVKGTIKAQRLSDDGYLRVSFATGKRSVKRTCLVADLVMGAFVGPKPPGMVVRHLDGTRAHNQLGNLAYGTPAENGADMASHGSMKGPRDWSRAVLKVTAELREHICAAASGREAARLYGVSATYAKDIRAGRA